jgi:hypothetical protein
LPGARELIRVLVERDVAVVLARSAPPDELALLRSVLDIDDLLTQLPPPTTSIRPSLNLT